MRPILMSLVTLVIGVVVLAACEGNVSSLKVGDCFNAPTINTEELIEITDVEQVSCDELHKNEVYAVFDLLDPRWKGDDYNWEKASKGCVARYEAFVGIEYELSRLEVNIILPSEESWKEDNDRLVQCSVSEVDIYGSTGSAKGSRR